MEDGSDSGEGKGERVVFIGNYSDTVVPGVEEDGESQ